MAAPYSADRKAVEGIVLAGGAGRRVGGRDKGLLALGESSSGAPGTCAPQPCAERAVELLRPLCSRVYISANRNRERYEAMGSDGVFADRRPAYSGPLAGLEALRDHLRSERLLLLPCDTLPPTPGPLLQLLDALDDREDLDLVYAASQGRDQYLVAALRKRALLSVGRIIDEGSGSVREWIEGLVTRRIELSAHYPLHNRNEMTQ
ncbi:MAG: NTP transferase domain-containing protein [Halieaceae bacterium]|jgi:molybdopterin-guanine dinucleotide biosynthesis protein A|nr:NTP transferase domain-containing protein [Halieaceae bacterium]